MKRKLNIAIICDSIDSTLWWSYISARRFALWLAKKWHHIVLCTSNFLKEENKKDYEYWTIYEFPGLFPIWPQHVRFAFAQKASLNKIFEKEKIDIVYNIHPCPIWRQAYRAANKSNIPFISHSHIYTELLIPRLPRPLPKLIKNIIAYFYKIWDWIIYPTEFAKKDFNEYKFTNKQAVISNWVNTDIFNTGTKTPETFNILSVWRLDPEKNLDQLLQALFILKWHKDIPKFTCTIVWSWSEEKKLKKLTNELNLKDIVIFTWKIEWKELVKEYQNWSVYVHNSFYELESMTTLEAMACWLPILIADSVHSAAKFFVQNNWYHFDPKNPKDLSNKLYKLIKHPETLIKMKKQSIKNSSLFSLTENVNKLEDFFLSFKK